MSDPRDREVAAPGRAASWALIAVFALGAVIRINNALRYRTELGFDARGNWIYIRRLIDSWALPAPDSGWSTAHPPFFYYLGAAVGRLLEGAPARWTLVAIPLLSSAIGLATIWALVVHLRRSHPDDALRAPLAAALLVFLPAHITLSAMLSEEILAASLTSLAILGVATQLRAPSLGGRDAATAGWLGAIAGLSLLTKLSGALVIASGSIAYAVAGLRRRAPLPLLRAALLFGLVGCVVGGWYYARNVHLYGYLYPQDLEVHGVILEMPPGERGLGDYLRFPLSTFSDPQLLDADLLRSVWGGTYATFWFDGHRHFLPRNATGVRAAGLAIGLLALLPTLAFFVGLGRGLRRAWRGENDVDAALLLLVAFTLAGYVHFTWQNPYYVCVKGSYLLGIAVPFAVYASEVLSGWIRRPRAVGGAVLGALLLLALLAATTFSYGLVFEKMEGPGLLWRELSAYHWPAAAP